jgi:hypothetical protein
VAPRTTILGFSRAVRGRALPSPSILDPIQEIRSMPSLVRAVAPAPGTSRRGWLGLSLSTLCFLHCIGAAALVPLLPAAFAFLTQNEVLEWALFGVSAALAAHSCWAVPPARHMRALLAAAAATTGLAALLLDQENLLRASLALLAVVQLWPILAGGRRCRG